jgi:hypothetical protein
MYDEATVSSLNHEVPWNQLSAYDTLLGGFTFRRNWRKRTAWRVLRHGIARELPVVWRLQIFYSHAWWYLTTTVFLVIPNIEEHNYISFCNLQTWGSHNHLTGICYIFCNQVYQVHMWLISGQQLITVMIQFHPNSVSCLSGAGWVQPCWTYKQMIIQVMVTAGANQAYTNLVCTLLDEKDRNRWATENHGSMGTRSSMIPDLMIALWC